VILIQVLVLNPATLPLWLAGLWYYFRDREGSRYRLLGWIYLTVLLALVATQSSRPDRAAGVYPMLLAGGTLLLEQSFRASPRRLWAPAMMALLIIGGLVAAPMGLPVLPPEAMGRYATTLGIEGVAAERGVRAALPTYYADRTGWEGMVQTIAQVYHDLPPEERAQAIILTGNYGEAGALDLLGRDYGLPRASSGHNNYFLWGPGSTSGQTVIVLGRSGEYLRSAYALVTRVAVVQCDYCLNYENNLPVYVARRPRLPLEELWPQLKHYQ